MEPWCPHVAALCAFVLGLAAVVAPVAAIAGSAAAGVLFAWRSHGLALAATLGLLPALYFWPESRASAGYGTLLALLAAIALLPLRAHAFPNPPRWFPALCILAAVAGFCAVLLYNGPLASAIVVASTLCAACAGALLARRFTARDTGALEEEGSAPASIARDLLLGRITSGMVHDLSQPLNVIAMANGNLGYIVEHLEIDAESKKQLLDRVTRISFHTEGAAHILGLFRWFGRDRPEDQAQFSIRSALQHAVSATKSNLQHPGIAIGIEGDALDYPLPLHHGRLEMMTVAALLSAFEGYALPDGKKRKGAIVLHAALEPAHAVVHLHCADEAGVPLAGTALDPAMHRLAEQLAREAGGDFREPSPGDRPGRFTLRLARHDI